MPDNPTKETPTPPYDPRLDQITADLAATRKRMDDAQKWLGFTSASVGLLIVQMQAVCQILATAVGFDFRIPEPPVPDDQVTGESQLAAQVRDSYQNPIKPEVKS